MPTFISDGVRIHYREFGPADGAPVLLLHGFASNARVNWISTGWTEFLAAAGFRVIAPDLPGHGESEKLHTKERYTAPAMAEDMARLLDHLGLRRAFVMGYSMGARVAAFLALAHPERICALMLAGMADNLIHGVGGSEEIARALLAENLDDPAIPAWARGFRQFAERTGSDLKALAACITAARTPLPPEKVRRLDALPVLIVLGEEDAIAGGTEEITALLPHAGLTILPRRNHMNAVGDREYKQTVVGFLHAHAGRCGVRAPGEEGENASIAREAEW